MRLTIQRHELLLARKWAIASRLGPGGSGGASTFPVAIVRLESSDGTVGYGETAPSSRYGETVETNLQFIERIDRGRLRFDDVPASMDYLESLGPDEFAAKGALNIALLDGAGHLAGKPVYDLLELGFREAHHVTSFSIGIDTPEVIHQKVLEAAGYPVLKLKVGAPSDRENLAALRSAAPTKRVRVDANEAWKTKEQALQALETLAQDPHIEFVEQPMPDDTDPADLAWLKERSPLPLMADESYRSAADLPRVLNLFHAVNVKLVKAGGITGSYQALKAARNAGLQTMLGCMIESSVLISAAAHLAELTDYLDIDGNLLITNDPFEGATGEHGQVSFAKAPRPDGLRVQPRSNPR